MMRYITAQPINRVSSRRWMNWLNELRILTRKRQQSAAGSPADWSAYRSAARNLPTATANHTRRSDSPVAQQRIKPLRQLPANFAGSAASWWPSIAPSGKQYFDTERFIFCPQL